MPQGRRKVPSSTKQKKLKLQQKRGTKNFDCLSAASSQGAGKEIKGRNYVEILNQQPSTSSKHNRNRYHLIFKKESNEEIEKRKLLSQQPFEPVSKQELEVDHTDVFIPGSELDMPKRPAWNYHLSKEHLEAQEEKYFREYVDELENKFGDKNLSHFELNLETWRQLWRVLEFSDIILLVVDIRYCVYHYSPALYDYVTKELKKDFILVLNKIDLVPAPLVLAWKIHFKENFPHLNILCFASYAGMILKEGKKGKRVGNLHMAIEGSRQLLKICEGIVKDQVNLSSWKKKIDLEANLISSSGEAYLDSDSEDDDSPEVKRFSKQKYQKVANDTSHYQGKQFEDNKLTIGFIGHPNVGKSSFLNAILGKKVVSVSCTPGHTKHYQTIMLTPNVRLCDCPGLVFPSLVPRPIQVLLGCYPIAQLREPYSAVEFLSQRVDVVAILRLTHPNADSFQAGKDMKWSSFDICESWAIKRGFVTAKNSRPDIYRAANNILRMALDGRTLCLAFLPPNFTRNEVMWSTHPGLGEIVTLQAHRAKERKEKTPKFEADYVDSEDSDESSSEDEENSEESSEEETLDDNKFSALGVND